MHGHPDKQSEPNKYELLQITTTDASLEHHQRERRRDLVLYFVTSLSKK